METSVSEDYDSTQPIQHPHTASLIRELNRFLDDGRRVVPVLDNPGYHGFRVLDTDPEDGPGDEIHHIEARRVELEMANPALVNCQGLQFIWAMLTQTEESRHQLLSGQSRFDLGGRIIVYDTFHEWLEAFGRLRRLGISAISDDDRVYRRLGLYDAFGNRHLVPVIAVRNRTLWDKPRIKTVAHRLGFTVQELLTYIRTPEGRRALVAMSGPPVKKQRLAKKGDKGTWKEHVEVDKPSGKERVPTGEEVPVRVTDDQEKGDTTVKVAPQGSPEETPGKEVPAQDLTIEKPVDD